MLQIRQLFNESLTALSLVQEDSLRATRTTELTVASLVMALTSTEVGVFDL